MQLWGKTLGMEEIVNMEKPTLVILAAGMGSRYGGLKQIDPVDPQGHKIIDFSIYDAVKAGFESVIFLIKEEHLEDFKEAIGDAIGKYVHVEYAFQSVDRIPEGCNIPEGRLRPWGTAHAILCCKDLIKGPFAVINADDYYGQSAFETIYNYLTSHQDDAKYRYAMVGYELNNTLTEHGSVSRGCCTIDENGYLITVVERTHIERRDGTAAYTEDGEEFKRISLDTIVSMNLWGFSSSIMSELEKAIKIFFQEEVERNPLKSECFIPFEVDKLLKTNKATVEVLSSSDKWFGVTYKEDKHYVEEAISNLKKQGKYPEKLWRL